MAAAEETEKDRSTDGSLDKVGSEAEEPDLAGEQAGTLAPHGEQAGTLAPQDRKQDGSLDEVSDIAAKRDPHTLAVSGLIRQYRELSVQEKMFFQSQIKVNKRLFEKTNNVFLFDDV